MHAILSDRLPEIRMLCKQFAVQSLFAFGSVLRPDFAPDSDIDLLVAFAPNESTGAFARFFGLKQALESLLLRPVDLISIHAITNPYFKEEIESTKATLYAA
jgi:uncharacterized protein